MKQLTFAAIIASLFLIFTSATAQEMKMGQERHKQMMAMMQDSTMMNMVMMHIAKDNDMRQVMMQKIIKTGKSDTSKMRAICKMMIEDNDMHAMMMKMMGGGMMKPKMMKKKSGMMQKKVKGEHEKHHRKEVTVGGNMKSTAQETIIKFKPGTMPEQIEAMASQIGLKYVKSIPALRLKVYQIPLGKSIEEIIANCEKHDFVEYAEANQIYKMQK